MERTEEFYFTVGANDNFVPFSDSRGTSWAHQHENPQAVFWV